MGSHVTRIMGFLPANFHLATPFHSRLKSGTRQTDRQTIATLFPPYVGGDIIIKVPWVLHMTDRQCMTLYQQCR